MGYAATARGVSRGGPISLLILDRDSKFDAEVISFLKATGLKPKHTSFQSPWQNGTAERWVGGCRKELLDFVIPLNAEHLRRLMREYIGYFQEDRIHDSLGKDTPNRRRVEERPSADATVISRARLGVCIIVTVGGKRHRTSNQRPVRAEPSTLLFPIIGRRWMLRPFDGLDHFPRRTQTQRFAVSGTSSVPGSTPRRCQCSES
jgi:hypothetical protein